MGIREFPNAPLELVSLDYLVNLPMTSSKHVHILSISDHFSKFCQFYPVRDRKAGTAAKCVFHYMLKFGIPLKLFSDRDPSFESSLFQELLRMLGVNKLRT